MAGHLVLIVGRRRPHVRQGLDDLDAGSPLMRLVC